MGYKNKLCEKGLWGGLPPTDVQSVAPLLLDEHVGDGHEDSQHKEDGDDVDDGFEGGVESFRRSSGLDDGYGDKADHDGGYDNADHVAGEIFGVHFRYLLVVLTFSTSSIAGHIELDDPDKDRHDGDGHYHAKQRNVGSVCLRIERVDLVNGRRQKCLCEKNNGNHLRDNRVDGPVHHIFGCHVD